MLSSDTLIGGGEDLGANACEAHNLRNRHFMRPIRKALATAWVRLTVSSFFVARLR
jgi:hypothetical protein